MPSGDLISAQGSILKKVKDNLKSSFITLNENIQRFLALMQMNFKMQKFRLEAMIIDKLSQKIKMLVAN